MAATSKSSIISHFFQKLLSLDSIPDKNVIELLHGTSKVLSRQLVGNIPEENLGELHSTTAKLIDYESGFLPQKNNYFNLV